MSGLFGFFWVFVVVCSCFIVAYHVPFVYVDYNDDVVAVLSYIDGKSPLQSSVVEAMSAEEIIHMNDVRFLFALFELLYVGVVALFVVLLWFQKDVLGSIARASVRGALVLLILSVVVLFAFDTLFIWFHELLFFNEYWLLPYDSFLIQLFPQSTFVWITAVTLISSISILFVVWFALSNIKKEKNSPLM